MKLFTCQGKKVYLVLTHRVVNFASWFSSMVRTSASLAFIHMFLTYCVPYTYQNNDGSTKGHPGFDVRASEVWKMNYTGRGVVVTVLDDGLDKNHLDLKDNFVSLSDSNL